MELLGHTLGTPDHSVPEALALFARCGLDGAEVIWQEDYPGGLRPGDRRQLTEVAAAAAGSGVPVRALTPYLAGLNSLAAGERQASLEGFRRCLASAHTLGATRLRVYAGTYRPEQDEPDRERMWGLLVAGLQQLAPVAAEAAVTLCVENHFGTMTPSARQTRRLVDAVGHPRVQTLYDQANLSFTGHEDWPEALALQAGTIAHAHVKDFVVTRPGARFAARSVARVAGDERTVASRVVGEGVLDWPAILGGLAAGGYRGYLSLEYEARWHPQDLPPPEDGLRRGARYLRSVLAGLGRTEVRPA